MDELAAAAAVVAMATDDFAEEELEQRSFCGTVDAADVDMAAAGLMAEDKENDGAAAAASDPENAASKVTTPTRTVTAWPCVQHLTHADSTLSLP